MRASGELVIADEAPWSSKDNEQPTDDEAAATDPEKCLLLLRLCVVGFLVNCQPSEPFLTKYLETVKGLSPQDLNDHVWPWDSYGSFA